jgi:TRAP-type C4-dicarboxylate transport system substrate-binding protein
VEPSDGDIPGTFKSSADAAITSPVIAFRVAELAKCVTIPGDYSLGFGYLPLLASRKGFERLNRTQQSVLLKVAKEAERSLADGYRGLDDYLVRMLGTSGVQTVTLSKADYDAWIKLAQASAYRDFAATVPGGNQLLDDAVAGK